MSVLSTLTAENIPALAGAMAGWSLTFLKIHNIYKALITHACSPTLHSTRITYSRVQDVNPEVALLAHPA